MTVGKFLIMCSLVECILKKDIQQLMLVLRSTHVANIFIDNDLNTPLHLATEKQYEDIVDLLLRAGASVDLRNKNRDTPLHKACSGANFKLVKLLLDGGASVNIPNKDGNTPFHIAIVKGYKMIFNAVVDRNADIHLITQSGDSPLHLAVKHCNIFATEALLERGALVNGVNNEGLCPLHIAVSRNCFGTTFYLLSRGASVNVVDNEGWTPLHLAVKEKNLRLAKLLISRGAFTNLQNCWGHTALHTAVRNADLMMVDILLSTTTVLPDVRDLMDHSPLHYALRTNYPILVFRLLRGGATYNEDDVSLLYLDHATSVKIELQSFTNKYMMILLFLPPSCNFFHECVYHTNSTGSVIDCFKLVCTNITNLKDTYSEEIEQLRTTKINDYSLYDVLLEGADLVKLHDIFKATMDSADFEANFPNFSHILRMVLFKAKTKAFHYKHAAEFFSVIHRLKAYPLLPSSVVKKIFSHLTDIDLQNLIACLENMFNDKVMQTTSWFSLYKIPFPTQ